MRRTLALALVTPVLGLVPAALSAPASAGTETCLGQTATITGTADDDEIHGTLLPDVVVLGDGNDKFYGKEGDDIVCGGAGNDRIFGGPGNDRLSGGGGRNKIIGGKGRDKITNDPSKP